MGEGGGGGYVLKENGGDGKSDRREGEEREGLLRNWTNQHENRRGLDWSGKLLDLAAWLPS